MEAEEALKTKLTNLNRDQGRSASEKVYLGRRNNIHTHWWVKWADRDKTININYWIGLLAEVDLVWLIIHKD